MKTWIKITSFIASVLYAVVSLGQHDINVPDRSNDKVTATELTIPASPVFDLMGVTPSQVTRMSDIKDFKVDWSFKSWRLNPNIALQGQPVWELAFSRKALSKYQKASPLIRAVSTLDVSIGTVQNENGDRRIGFATKINAWKQKDPLLDRRLYAEVENQFREEKVKLEAELTELKKALAGTTDILEKPELRQQIEDHEQTLLSINSRRNAEINRRAKIFSVEHWNASSIDIAFGKIYTYATDSSGSLLALRLNRNTAAGVWLNGGLGIGRNILISGLARSSFYQERLQFALQDSDTEEITAEEAIADNILISVGLNLRYGSPVYTFFAEVIYERKQLKTPTEALEDAFQIPSNKSIVQSSVKWDVVPPYSIAVGGDWRMNRNVILNYGVRWLMNKDFKTTTFIPLVSLSCMMR